MISHSVIQVFPLSGNSSSRTCVLGERVYVNLGRIVKFGYLLPCILDVKHSHHHIAKHLLQDILSTASITIAFSTCTSVYRSQGTRTKKLSAEKNPQESKNHVCASQLSFPPCHATPRHPSPPYVELMQKCTNEVEEKTMHARKTKKRFSAPFSNGSRGKRWFFFFEGSNYHMPDGGISEQTWLDLTEIYNRWYELRSSNGFSC